VGAPPRPPPPPASAVSRPASRFIMLDAERAAADFAARTGVLAIRPALFDEAPLHAGFEGFVLDASGFTLNDAALGIAAMTVTLPLSNTDGSGPAQLTGVGIGIASSGAVSGTLGLPHYAGSLFGFPTAADNLRLGDHALRLDAITVTLPLSNTDGTAPAQVVARGGGANPAPVSIDPHGNVIGALSLDHFAGSFFGFGLAADNVRLGNHALRVDAITVTLPLSNSDETGPLQLTASGDNASGVGIDAKGNVTGNLGLAHAAGKLLGFDATLDRLSLGDHALRVGAITVTLPLSNTDGTGPALLVATGSRTDPSKPISIDAKGHVDGDLTLSSLKGSLFGFPTAVSNLTVGDHLVSVQAITVTLPFSNSAGTGPALLVARGDNGNPVSIDTKGHVTGNLSLTSLKTTLLGFPTEISNLTLGDHAVSIRALTVTLPLSATGGTPTPYLLTATGVRIRSDGSIAGTIGLSELHGSFLGFKLDTGKVTLGNHMLTLASFALTLPDLFGKDASGANRQITASAPVSIDNKGHVVGTVQLPDLDTTFQGFEFHGRGITLGSGGIGIADASVPVPYLTLSGGAPATLHGSLNLASVTSAAASLGLSNVDVTYGGSLGGLHLVNASLGSGGIAVDLTYPLPAIFGGDGVTRLEGMLNVTVAGGGYSANATLSLQGGGGGRRAFTFGGFAASAGAVSLSIGSGTGIALTATDVRVLLTGLSDTAMLTGNLSAGFANGAFSIGGNLSASNIPISFGGFQIMVGSLTLGSTGTSLDHATVTLPDIAATPLVLQGSLYVTRDPASGRITFNRANLGLSSARVSLFTLPATLQNLSLGLGGPDGHTATLTVGSAAVDLSGLGGLVDNLSVTSLAVSNLSIVVDTSRSGFHVKFSGGAISAGFSFDAIGGHVVVQGLTLRNDDAGEGIGARAINVTLPSALGGSQVSINDFLLFTTVDKQGVRHYGMYGAGRTPSFGFDLDIARVTATGGIQLGLGANGFYIGVPKLDLSLPDPLGGGVSLTGLSYDRQGFHLGGVGGTIHAALPAMNFAAFRIDHVSADLAISTVAGRRAPVFVFAAQGDLILNGVNDGSGAAGIHVEVQVGSVVSPYKTVFRGLTINIELPAGLAIPIGPTPFGINGGGGGVNVLDEGGHAVYAFHLDVHVITIVDGGNLLSGDVRAAITTNGNLGLSANATVLKFIGGGGGFCFRNTVPPLQPDGKTRDGVCKDIGPMGPQIEKSTATGIFAEVYEGLYVDRPDGCRRDQDECISLVGSAYAHFWKDTDGAEVAAILGVRFKLPEGSIWHYLPPFDVVVGAQAQLGKFTYQTGPRRVFGVKGDVYAQGPCVNIPFTDIGGCLSFSKSVFVQLSDGLDIHLTGSDDYTLYDTVGAPPPDATVQPNDVSSCAQFPTFTPVPTATWTPRPGVPVYRPPVGAATATPKPSACTPTSTPTTSSAPPLPPYRPPVTEGPTATPTSTPWPPANGTPQPTATPRTYHCINNKCDNGNSMPAAASAGVSTDAGASYDSASQRVAPAVGQAASASTLMAGQTGNGPIHQRDGSFSVEPGQTDTIFVLSWRHGDPTLTLTAPDGTVYTSMRPSSRANPFFRTTADSARDGHEQIIYTFQRRPLAGTWRVTIGNLHGGEGVFFTMGGNKPRPVLRVTAPAARRTLVANHTATLAGTLGGRGLDPGVNTVSLYYTNTRTAIAGGKTVPNYAGQLIASGVPVRGGRWSYRWDTSTLPAGTYDVYASLDNGAGPAVNAYAAGTVRVAQPALPGDPRAVMATQGGRQLRIVWAPPAYSGNVAGYALRWRTSNMPGGHYYTYTLGNRESYDLAETLTDVRYSATVSAYDVFGHQSRAVLVRLAAPVANRRGADYRADAGRISMNAGGYASIPLRVRPLGRATGGASDIVRIAISGAPAGVTVQPSVDALNLFAQPGGLIAPVLQVQTFAMARPGAYRLRVTVRQDGTGRARIATAVLVVRVGMASRVYVSAGRASKRGRLLAVPVVARVVDTSGTPVDDGTGIHLTASAGALQAIRVAMRGGLARTTLLYAPGQHPVVTADAFTAKGATLVGAAPRGAFRLRFFAASARRHEDIVLRNPFGVPMAARLYLHVDAGAGGVTRQVVPVQVFGHDTVVEDVRSLTAGRPLVGVVVESDLPVYSERVAHATVRRVVVRGKRPTVVTREVVAGRSGGVAASAATYRLRLPVGRHALDLYNLGTRSARVVMSIGGAGGRVAATVKLILARDRSNRLDLASQLKRAQEGAADKRTAGRGSHAHVAPAVTVTVRATAPIVVEVEP